jgi:hypothetical protein
MRRLAPLPVLLLAAVVAWLVLSGAEESARRPAGDSPAVDVERPRPSGPVGTASRGASRETEGDARKRRHAAVSTPATAEAPEEETRRFTLKVVDQADRPVAGAAVVLADEKGGPSRFTRSDGTTWRDVPLDVTELTARSDLFDPIEITDEETVVRLDDLVPLEVHFVDQETGRPVEVTITGSPLETDNVQSHRGYTVWRTRVAPVRPGRTAGFHLLFSAPDGYALMEEDGVERGAFVSRYAERVRTTVPVARELKLTVTVLTHDGKPAKGATVTASVTGRRSTQSSVETAASGVARVTDLPFVRGERLSLSAFDFEGRRADGEEVLLVDADRELTVTLRLSKEPSNGAIGIGGGSGSSFVDRLRRRPPPDGSGRLSISATRRNGLPAAGAFLFARGPVSRTGRADEDGRLEFSGLPAGTYIVTMREPGLVATSQEVELVDGEARTIAVREIEGRTATVRVVDAEGLPLPNVRVSVRLPWGHHVQVVDGVQDLDHWTDLSGRVRFVDLPSVPVTVTATLGSRSEKRKLEGDTLDVTLPNR